MRPGAFHTAAAILCALAAAASAAQFEQAITFREPLGQAWTDELIHYDLRVPQPKVAAATFALADAEGKPVPLQVEPLEGSPAAVRRARLWLKTTLPAGREVAYRLTYNDEGRKAAQPGPALVVRRGDARLIVLAGRFEVMIPAPDKPFEKPVPLKKTPAPLLGLRPTGEQSWYGAWSLDGPAYVRELKATVEAAGPVYALVRLRYVFDDRGQAYEVTLRITRDEPWVDVSERYRLAAGCRMTAAFRSRKPPEVLWMPWCVGRGDRAEPAYDLRRLVLDERVAADAPFAALRPRLTQVRDATQVLLALGPGDAGRAIGVIMTCAGEWVRPYENFPTARLARATPALSPGGPLAAAPAGAPEGQPVYGGVAVDFPLVDGRRRWALVAVPRDPFDSKDDVQRLIRRAADLPLDRVLGDWVLAWPRGRVDPAPHLATTWDRLRRLREDLAAGRETPAANLIARIMTGEVPGDRRLAEILAARREASAAIDIAPILAACYQAPDLGPAAWPRRLPDALVEADLAAAGRAPQPGEPSTALDAAVALLAYVFTDPNYQPGAAGGWEPGSGDPAGLHCIIPLYAAAMLPDHPHAGRWSAAALAALREDLRRTGAVPADAKGQEPAAGPLPPAQQAAALVPILAAMRIAAGARLEDPFRWPQVRPAVEMLMGLHTPPDPRLGRRDLAPFGGASGAEGRGGSVEGGASPWHDGVGAIFGLAAAGFREADGAFAAQCAALYRNYYGAGASGDLAADLAAAEAGGPARLEAALAARAWPGFGAVLRSRAGTDREAFVAFKCGPPPSTGGRTGPRASAGPDEMAFQFFGAGMPVAPGWHAAPPLRMVAEHMYNRITLGDSENMDAAGELLALESADAADVAVGQVRATALRKLPRWPQEIGRAAAFPRRTLAAEVRWRRYLLLVKHAAGPLEDYLVVRDELASAEPSAFNLWVLGRSVRQDGRLFYFDGQLAADAVVFVAAPDVDRVRLDRWAWPRQDESSMIPEDFRPKVEGVRSPDGVRLLTPSSTWRTGELQQHLSVGAGPGEDYLVVVYPLRKGSPVPEFQVLAKGKGVRVTLSGATEDVFLAADPAPEAGGQASVRRGGQTAVILKPGDVPAAGKEGGE
jgi:hypothetical protein